LCGGFIGACHGRGDPVQEIGLYLVDKRFRDVFIPERAKVFTKMLTYAVTINHVSLIVQFANGDGMGLTCLQAQPTKGAFILIGLIHSRELGTILKNTHRTNMDALAAIINACT